MSPNDAAKALLKTIRPASGPVNVWTWYEPEKGFRLRVTTDPGSVEALSRILPKTFEGYVVVVEPAEQAFGFSRLH